MHVPTAQDALVHEAEPLQRRHRADVLRGRERGDPEQAEPPEPESEDQRLRVAVDTRPPVLASEPRTEHGAAVAAGGLPPTPGGPGPARTPQYAHVQSP